MTYTVTAVHVHRMSCLTMWQKLTQLVPTGICVTWRPAVGSNAQGAQGQPLPASPSSLFQVTSQCIEAEPDTQSCLMERELRREMCSASGERRAASSPAMLEHA